MEVCAYSQTLLSPPDLNLIAEEKKPRFSIDQDTKVLMVEDHQLSVMLMGLIIMRQFPIIPEYNITTVDKAEDALEYEYSIKDGSNLIIILDNGLRGAKTGLEIAPVLRKKYPLAMIIFNSHDSYIDLKKYPDINKWFDGYANKMNIEKVIRGIINKSL